MTFAAIGHVLRV